MEFIIYRVLHHRSGEPMLRTGAGLISREVHRPVHPLRVRLHWVHQRNWPEEGSRSNSPGEPQETFAVLCIGDFHVDSH